jgi:hypothetical protein
MLHISGINFITVARLFNVCCRSEAKVEQTTTKQRKVHCKIVPRGDHIPFLNKELSQKKSYDDTRMLNWVLIFIRTTYNEVTLFGILSPSNAYTVQSVSTSPCISFVFISNTLFLISSLLIVNSFRIVIHLCIKR